MTYQETLFDTPQTELSSDDHYTPKWVFDTLALTFDIDVASPPGGIPWIPAKRHFTMADDGLSQPWEGIIWMNPPYSAASEWVRRFREHNNGVALLPMVDSWWMHDLWNDPKVMCVRGASPKKYNLEFHHKGKLKKIMFPTMFYAMGDEAQAAIKNLGKTR